MSKHEKRAAQKAAASAGGADQPGRRRQEGPAVTGGLKRAPSPLRGDPPAAKKAKLVEKAADIDEKVGLDASEAKRRALRPAAAHKKPRDVDEEEEKATATVPKKGRGRKAGAKGWKAVAVKVLIAVARRLKPRNKDDWELATKRYNKAVRKMLKKDPEAGISKRSADALEQQWRKLLRREGLSGGLAGSAFEQVAEINRQILKRTGSSIVDDGAEPLSQDSGSASSESESSSLGDSEDSIIVEIGSEESFSEESSRVTNLDGRRARAAGEKNFDNLLQGADVTRPAPCSRGAADRMAQLAELQHERAEKAHAREEKRLELLARRDAAPHGH